MDHKLVGHYFGSKAALFATSVDLPIRPEIVVDQVLPGDPARLGERAARLLVGALADEQTGGALMGLLRAVTTEPEVAPLVRDVLVSRILRPIAAGIGAPDPELRASLVASLVVGLAVGRNAVRLPALVASSPETLIAALAPALQHYFTGAWTDGERNASG